MNTRIVRLDVADMLTVCDELIPFTNEELGQYWFGAKAASGVSVSIAVSVFEGTCSITVKSDAGLCYACVDISDCTTIRVVDLTRRIIELRVGDHDNPRSRCVVALDAECILQMDCK